MKTARVLYQGQVLSAVESDGQLLMANGQRVSFDAVTWLPPFAPTPRPRTILALGLNYADHAKELAFKAPEEPLVFIKGEGPLIGHRTPTPRPPSASPSPTSPARAAAWRSSPGCAPARRRRPTSSTSS